MIIVVDGLNRHQFSDVLDEMFELRARVFGEDIPVRNIKRLIELNVLALAFLGKYDRADISVLCSENKRMNIQVGMIPDGLLRR